MSFISFTLYQIVYGDQTKEDGMGGACRTHLEVTALNGVVKK
jgi:hypothetical protein